MLRELVPCPDQRFEDELLADGYTVVAGVDEVGRGPLAGPVTAAAVILDLSVLPEGLNDSKKLGPRERERLTLVLQQCAQISVAHATVEEIDRLNILRASHLAMCRAVEGLSIAPNALLVDGSLVPRGLKMPARALVKGDARSLSIAAASIVAKTARDRIMAELAEECPGYGWETNAGYPTPAHKAALLDLGVSRHHRRSFRPVHNILYQGKFLTP
ncbi:ribonuclease HII [Chachezhania antarctica]|uniref:ribonuclease HII n=1 Tax=Chachezhania antarctica TaxID=2340860 RepID=UPI000EB59FC1|nr:ribonuclease HII [Chachezhania antarctica]